MSTMPSGKESGGSSDKSGLPVLMFVVQAWATSVEVFLHRGFGERYLGLQAGAVLLLVPLYCLAWPHYDLRPMMMFLLAYLVMYCTARSKAVLRRWRGEQFHSYYTGRPRLMRLLPRCDEVAVKRFIEPLIVLGIGYLSAQGNRPFGTYLMCAAACLIMSVTMSVAWSRTRALDLNDAVFDQQEVAERFRAMRGER